MTAPRLLAVLAAAAALAGCGEDEAARLRQESVAALEAGRFADATRLADAAAERGGAAYEGDRAFVHGNAAFARSEAAEASRPGGSRAALEASILAAEDAVASWAVAAGSRADWPAARRNVERGLLRLARLRRLAARPEGARSAGGPGDATTPPRPPERAAGTPSPPPAPPPGPGEAAAPDEAAPGPLPAERVLGLLEVLRAKEREKAALRRARAPATAAGSGKDW